MESVSQEEGKTARDKAVEKFVQNLTSKNKSIDKFLQISDFLSYILDNRDIFLENTLIGVSTKE